MDSVKELQIEINKRIGGMESCNSKVPILPFNFKGRKVSFGPILKSKPVMMTIEYMGCRLDIFQPSNNLEFVKILFKNQEMLWEVEDIYSQFKKKLGDLCRQRSIEGKTLREESFVINGVLITTGTFKKDCKLISSRYITLKTPLIKVNIDNIGDSDFIFKNSLEILFNHEAVYSHKKFKKLMDYLKNELIDIKWINLKNLESGRGLDKEIYEFEFITDCIILMGLSLQTELELELDKLRYHYQCKDEIDN